MPLPTPKTEAEREAKHLMKRLALLKHDWPSELSLNNLSSLTVTALLKHIAAQDKVQATSYVVLTTMALLSLCGMKSGIYRPFTLAHGANPFHADKDGITPLKFAQQQKRPDLVALMRHGGK